MTCHCPSETFWQPGQARTPDTSWTPWPLNRSLGGTGCTRARRSVPKRNPGRTHRSQLIPAPSTRSLGGTWCTPSLLWSSQKCLARISGKAARPSQRRSRRGRRRDREIPRQLQAPPSWLQEGRTCRLMSLSCLRMKPPRRGCRRTGLPMKRSQAGSRCTRMPQSTSRSPVYRGGTPKLLQSGCGPWRRRRPMFRPGRASSSLTASCWRRSLAGTRGRRCLRHLVGA